MEGWVFLPGIAWPEIILEDLDFFYGRNREISDVHAWETQETKRDWLLSGLRSPFRSNGWVSCADQLCPRQQNQNTEKISVLGRLGILEWQPGQFNGHPPDFDPDSTKWVKPALYLRSERVIVNCLYRWTHLVRESETSVSSHQRHLLLPPHLPCLPLC